MMHNHAAIAVPENIALPNKIIGAEHDPARLTYPKKSECSAHAERRVLAAAAKHGFVTNNQIMYAPWFSCTGCAIHIGESGIRKVVGHLQAFQYTPQRWITDIQRAHAMLDHDYGVEIMVLDEVLNDTVFMDGVLRNV